MKKITLKFPANNFRESNPHNKWDKVLNIKSRTVTEDKILATLLEIKAEFILAYAEGVMFHLVGNYSDHYVQARLNEEVRLLTEGQTASDGVRGPVLLWVSDSVTEKNVSFSYSNGRKYFSEGIFEPTYVLGKRGKIEAYFEIENVD